MLREPWVQHLVAGVITLAALAYLIASARRRKKKNACPYCPAGDRPDMM